MKTLAAEGAFQPGSPDAAGVISWVHLGDLHIMKRIHNSHVWEADVSAPHEGVYCLKVSVEDTCGKIATDKIRVVRGDLTQRERAGRDQDNALAAWPEHGLLGTRLGPNKNGKKW